MHILNKLFRGLKKKTTRPEQVRDLLAHLPEMSAKLEYLLHNRQFRVDQKKPEFLRFLQETEAVRPNQILEIGGRRGGSSLLLSHAAGDQARVLTIDLNNTGSRLHALQRLCTDRPIQFWQGDSHRPETLERVQEYLRGQPLDILFIDGDHSYAGARQDFITYSPLVRDQGLIALHDIQQDYATRYGVKTAAWTGGVPRFWEQLKLAGFACEELISDPYQDGYGIGLVRWRGGPDAQLTATLQELDAAHAA